MKKITFNCFKICVIFILLFGIELIKLYKAAYIFHKESG